MATELNCAKCGACAVVCPVFRIDGREVLTARGKMHLLTTTLAKQPSAVFEDLFSRCLLCGACEQVCPRQLPITDLISEARSTFSPFYGPNGLKKAAACTALSHPELLDGLVKAGISLQRFQSLPLHSGLRLKLGLLEEKPLPAALQESNAPPQEKQSTASLSYFTGCVARHIQPSIAEATQTLLSKSNLPAAHVPTDQYCCGLAAWSAGKREQARELARKNIHAFSAPALADTPIITSCASCSSHLLAYPTLFDEHDPWHGRALAFADRVREFTSFFDDKLPASPRIDTPEHPNHPKQRIFYHDPCHLRFKDKGMSAPRSLLQKTGVHILEPEKGPLCCGQGGLFHLACPEHTQKIFQKGSEQALAGAPDCITTTCSGCLMQYQEGLARQGQQIKVIQVVHMAVILADKLSCQGHS
ncbi:glycolate oxidase iron-sulfur subunit [Candidatus Electrothrix aarhusensis]|uniref:Glycolate oxidase iron-sulfur subunit n=1 Tax=Candidatus Electrothrix aarhusensis TaxID=1859131 RepID=A0A3S3QFM5_9BACT|nr:glycolate oxidase iron-sulfur subunit [Candidatus Electrothrix aarhusensis]